MSLTQEMVRELLDYNPETGVFTWRHRGREYFKSQHGFRAWNARNAGKKAGNVNTQSTGYQCRYITVLGKSLVEHRVVWLWMSGDYPSGQIDHINRDATDNRWCNLRTVSHADNGRNISMRRDNTSGVTGVRWFKQMRKWQARCRVNGKLHHIGYFQEINDAAEAVRMFRSEHGFSPSHGLETAHYHKEWMG